MSLFSSKKKTYVGTSVSRVIEDKMLPDAVKNGVLQAIYKDYDVVQSVMEETIGSIGIKAERMYEYGNRGYLYGLPNSQIVHQATVADVVQGVLSMQVGQAVALDYCEFGAINNLHVGWVQLTNQYGYDGFTNEIGALSAEKGVPVFLEDMVVVVTDATFEELNNGQLKQWGTPPNAGKTKGEEPLPFLAVKKILKPSPYEVSALAGYDYCRVHYVWEEEITETANNREIKKKVTKRDTLQLPFGGFSLEDDYFMARYSFDDQVRFFTYQEGTGLYPELDILFATEHTGLGSFFPFGYLRYEKKNPTEDKTTPEYKSSKKLLGYLGMDFDQVVDAVHANPDIKDVEQAMVTMAVPANTTNPLEQRYLFDFFKRLYLESRAAAVPLIGQNANVFNIFREKAKEMAVVIQDARFKMTLGYTGIFKKYVAGSIGEVGTYSGGRGVEATPETYINSETGDPYTQYYDTPYYFYRKQVTGTMYEEYRIFNLKMTYHIWARYTAVGDETDEILLVPLDRSITHKYAVRDRETLYARSLHFVFNSRVTVKVKWYQQDWFSVFLIIVAIIITIASMGSDGGSSLGAALAAGDYVAAAYIIVTAIVEFVVLQVAFKFIAKLLGADAALILAAIAAAYGMYDAYSSGGVAGAPWAKDLLTIANGLVKGVTDNIGDMMLGLKKAQEAFGLEVAEKTELLEKAQNLLETNSHLAPLIIEGETPESFYQRTVHSGNIGIVGIEAISQYVDMSLTLPTFSNTIGEFA